MHMQKQAKQKALKQAYVFAPIIYLINVIVLPLMEGKSLSMEAALRGIPIALLSALIYFFVIYSFEKKKSKK